MGMVLTSMPSVQAAILTAPQPFASFKATALPLSCQTSADSLAKGFYRQWPWRLFAFASDLGTVGYLVNKPALGLLGWMIALPYYGVSILRQPNRAERRDELLYQATANGLFPLVEAKAGAVAGEWLFNKTGAWVQKHSPISALTRLTSPVYKALGSLGAMLALTPLLGDPLGHWCLGQYRKLSNLSLSQDRTQKEGL